MQEQVFTVTGYDTRLNEPYFIGIFLYIEDAMFALEQHKRKLTDYVEFVEMTETYAKDSDGAEYFWNVECITKTEETVDIH